MTVILSDGRIAESSGLACSKLHRGYAYTANDDPTTPHLFTVDVLTGKTVGTASIKGAKFSDLEAVEVSGGGLLALGDIGDNEAKRDWIAVWFLPEPTPARGSHPALKATRYRFRYPDGSPRNAETLIFHPLHNRRYIVTKTDGRAHVYRFPEKLSRYRVNSLVYVGTIPRLSLVTDGAFTPDGDHVLFRQKGVRSSVAVVYWPTLKVVDYLDADRVKQPESVAVEWDGQHFIYGSEGQKSPLGRSTLPREFG